MRTSKRTSDDTTCRCHVCHVFHAFLSFQLHVVHLGANTILASHLEQQSHDRVTSVTSATSELQHAAAHNPLSGSVKYYHVDEQLGFGMLSSAQGLEAKGKGDES